MYSSIFISKLGVRYENIYYYKQKVVNWDFVAPSSYECLLTTPINNNVILFSTSVSLKNAYNYISINVSTYVTEEGYKDNTIYYDITITNITSPTIPVLLIDYTNTNTDTVIKYNKVNSSLVTSNLYYNIIKLPIKFNIPLIYPINDKISATIFSQFPRGTHSAKYDINECSINFVANSKIIPNNEKIQNNTRLSIFRSSDIIVTPVSIDIFDVSNLVMTYNSYKSNLVLCCDRLPVTTKVHSGVEFVDVDMFNVNTRIYTLSTLSISHSLSTYIVH